MNILRRLLIGVVWMALACGSVLCMPELQIVMNENALEQCELSEEYVAEGSDKEKYVTSVEQLLGLVTQEFYKQIDDDWKLNDRERKALFLANRVITMYRSVDYSQADNVWMWAEAADCAVWQYAKENKMKYDTAVYDLHHALSYAGYSGHTQFCMNQWAWYMIVIYTYDAAMQYKELIGLIEDQKLQKLVREEFNAWFEWADAQFFTNVYFTHGADRYSALPLDYMDFYHCLLNNRLAVLAIEEDILVKNKAYTQKGKTVTSKEWSSWLTKNGYRDGMSADFNLDDPYDTDFPALNKHHTEKWIAVRQSVSHYLGNEKGKGLSYDKLTADIHACVIGRLKPFAKCETNN